MERQRGKQTVLSLLVYKKARERERERGPGVYRDLRHTTFCTTSERARETKDFTYTHRKRKRKKQQRKREGGWGGGCFKCWFAVLKTLRKEL
jgi:hypothetical protein